MRTIGPNFQLAPSLQAVETWAGTIFFVQLLYFEGELSSAGNIVVEFVPFR